MSHKSVFPLYKTGVDKAPVINPDVISYSTQQQSLETIIQRKPASQYLVLDSKNRFYSATPNQAIDQPWNNFRLQKAESLMQSYATRLTVSEIRFPWFIPNVSTLNNKLYIIGKATNDNPIVHTLELESQFYSPQELIDEINRQILLLDLENEPTFRATQTGQTEITVQSPSLQFPIYISWIPITDLNASYNSNSLKYKYYTTPSLARTLGFTFEQATYNINNPIRNQIVGNPTEYLYTKYCDLVSNKLNQYTTNLDGSSDITSNRLLVRIYLSDETSTFENYGNSKYAPFLIHRQFKNPKEVMWNKESVVDWLDISVRDEYGNLVELPIIDIADQNPDEEDPESSYLENISGSYPDFQLTLLASEN